jgi:hypothetical protein
MSLPRPGCLVRSTLALCGTIFLPMAIWFAVGKGWSRYWPHSVGLFVASALFYYLAFSRNAWLEAIDDIGR